jgi:electron transport complex protein RnfC
MKTEVFPAPPIVVIPLSQHIGAPARAIVGKGDRVLVGMAIGEASGHVSAAIHSSVSGTVRAVKPFAHPSGHLTEAVEIENDGTDETVEFEPIGASWREAAQGELVRKIAASGIVGLGGASFPTHVKLSPPTNKPIDTLIINGAECEPYLTDDHRIMVERTEDVINGALMLKKILGAAEAYIGIEDNKQDAINAVYDRVVTSKFDGLKLTVLKSKYPQGGEKQIIDAITKRKVPTGGLPMDIGCVVQNVGTALAVFEAIMHGIPLYQRVVTVVGDGVRSPKNLLVRIGTPARTLLEACNADLTDAKKVIMGGPMMGLALPDLDAPVIKSTSGILVLNQTTEPVRKYPCINCGICMDACPIRLVPSRLAKFVEKNNIEDAISWNLMDCMECGSCAYVCPAKINLVQFYKLGKIRVREKRAAEKKAG